MNAVRFAGVLAVAIASGCSGSDRPPAAGAGGIAGTGGSGNTDSGTSGSSAAGATNDAANPSDGGASGSDGGTPRCGDGIASSTESCDGSDLAGATCSDFGFDDGTLLCTATCEYDPSGCSGVENCFDARDNDGDGLVDCIDDTCTGPCAEPCTTAPVLSDPANVTGTTEGRATQTVSSCTPATSTSGPDMVYKFTALHTGRLDVTLQSGTLLNVSVRSSCTDVASELGCSRSRLTVPITAGQNVYIAVDGYEASDAGLFTLSAASRPVVCGDLIRDDVEECDDGNSFDGDGCDSTCHVESTETESNDDAATADDYVRPFFGQILPAGDQDVVAFTLTEPSSTLTAESQSFDDRACELELMDTVIDILATDGTTVLASDDDGGTGRCSLAVKSGLSPGTYYVRISAAPGSTPTTFPYQLTVTSTSP